MKNYVKSEKGYKKIVVEEKKIKAAYSKLKSARKKSLDRQRLKKAYVEASRAVRAGTVTELKESNHLAGEGLDKPFGEL